MQGSPSLVWGLEHVASSPPLYPHTGSELVDRACQLVRILLYRCLRNGIIPLTKAGQLSGFL